MCDSAGETGEGDVEKFLVRVLLLLPQSPRTEGRGEEKRRIMRCLKHCVQGTQLVLNLDLSYEDVLIMLCCQ